MPLISNLNSINGYTTKDGSTIRELMHPNVQGNQLQSLAEARVLPGQTTQLHRHQQSEELYHITQGEGEMTLADETFNVQQGDTICIPPGTPHCIHNSGSQELHILCACAPAYSHQDTEILG